MNWLVLALILGACHERVPDAPPPPAPPPDDHGFVSAVRQNDAAVIARALGAGLDPNARDSFGETALNWAVLRHNDELVAELLRRGGGPNLPGAHNKTPVHWAAQEGKVEILRKLVGAGGDIRALDQWARGPLMYAAVSNDIPVTDLLLSMGAPVDARDKDGKTAAQLALLAGSGKTVERLILAGADMDLQDGQGDNLISLALKKNKLELLLTKPILKKYPKLKQKLTRKGRDVILNGHERPRLDPERIARHIHQMVNRKRRESGFPALQYDERLAGLAAAHCKNMKEKGFFGSVTPSGQGPLARAREYGIGAQGEAFTIGENDYQGRIYSGFSAEVKKGIRYCSYQWHGPESLANKALLSWLSRSEYRANILSDRYNRSGVGLAFDDQMRVWIVQNFAHLGEPLKTVVVNEAERPKVDAVFLSRYIHEALNKARAKENLPPLLYDEALAELAAAHSLDMAHNGFLDHINPLGEDPTARAKKQGLAVRQRVEDYFLERGVGENICRVRLYSATEETVFDGVRSIRFNWLSPAALADAALDQWLEESHGRANLLGSAFDRHGVGVALDKEDRLYLTQKLYSHQPLEDLNLVTILNEDDKPELDYELLAKRIHTLINAERGRNGLKPLLYDPKLARLATAHSLDMAKRGFFEHLNLEGEDATGRASRLGFETSKRIGFKQFKSGIGENIYRDRLFQGFELVYRGGRPQASPRWYELETLARRTVEAWMNSETHRENLLTAVYRGHGIGLAEDKEARIFVTQNLF